MPVLKSCVLFLNPTILIYRLDQTVSSTTENVAVVKVEQLSPKVMLEYSKSIEMETKTTKYSRRYNYSLLYT